MTVFSDALSVEDRPRRHDTATSHITAPHGPPAATCDPDVVAALLRALLEQIDTEGWT